MSVSEIAGMGVMLLAGVAGGVIVGGPIAIVVGVVIGAGLAAGVALLRVRLLVATSLATAGVAGLFVGTAVVHVLCLPSTCAGLEAFGGTVTALGALVGVGIVVALATRSFDEYREAIDAGRTPPQPGCETDVDGYE